MRYTLSRRERLRGSEVGDVLRRGRRWDGAWVRIVWCENSCAWDRAAFVVSRRAGNAVRRNRVRRLLREAFRLGKRAHGPWRDIVVVARKAAGLELSAVQRDLEKWRSECAG